MSPDIDAAGLPAAHGGSRAAVSISGMHDEDAHTLRAAVYIDGFNLYHAIDDLEQAHLKWVNLVALSRKIIVPEENLVRVAWCTAVNTRNTEKMLRWREYRKAQIHLGVSVVEGHFTEEPRRCPKGHEYFHPTEKEGDVNLAIHLISDAHLNVYDVAYLVTADSDQIATAKLFRSRFPTKRIVSVAPPKRSHSKAIRDVAHGIRSITQDMIERSLLPGPSIISDGTLVARRPPSYEPPK